MPARSDPFTVTLQRRLVGTLAAGCLIGAAIAAWFGSLGEMWPAALLRIGTVLAVLWLALPARGRPAAWAELRPLSLAILAGVLLLAARAPKVGLPLLAGLILVRALVTPRRRGR